MLKGHGIDTLPSLGLSCGDDASSLGADWWALKAWRELDNAILNLRFNYRDVGLVLVETRGSIDTILELDKQLLAHQSDWFVHEVLHHMKRVLKRMDITSKSFFALIDEDSCFAGSMFELTLSADRSYMLEEETEIALSDLNKTAVPSPRTAQRSS